MTWILHLAARTKHENDDDHRSLRDLSTAFLSHPPLACLINLPLFPDPKHARSHARTTAALSHERTLIDRSH